MSTRENSLLIARWLPGRNRDVDPPQSVRWADGQEATCADYLKHQHDTRSELDLPDGAVSLMYPDIRPVARFDRGDRRWFVFGIGQSPIALDLYDSRATDDAIADELGADLFIYKLQVVR